MSGLGVLGRYVALPAGVALGGVTAAMALARRSRPLHPRGVVVPVRVVVPDDVPELGSVGRAGTREAVARVSRAVGLPDQLPDIQGLAVRWYDDDGVPADLLLSSTGTSLPTRFCLTWRRRPLAGPMTTLLPYIGRTGPVLLGAWPSSAPRPGGTATLDLAWARPLGPWQVFGRLDVLRPLEASGESPIRFEPAGNAPRGLPLEPWVASLRHYAYRWARSAYRT